MILKSAENIDRVLKQLGPVCQLKNFGDLELRLWISDPEKGPANLSRAARRAIWDSFAEDGIEILFHQRDLNQASVITH